MDDVFRMNGKPASDLLNPVWNFRAIQNDMTGPWSSLHFADRERKMTGVDAHLNIRVRYGSCPAEDAPASSL